MGLTRKKKFVIVIVFLLVTIGIFYYKDISLQFNQLNTVNNDNVSEDLGIPVNIAPVEKKDLMEKLSFVGTIEANESVQVSAKIPAQIIELNIEEGGNVEKGEVIGRLESKGIEAKIKTTNVAIEKAKLNLDYISQEEVKYKTLYDQGAIAEAAYNKINHEKKMAEIQLQELHSIHEELMINLEDSIIKAPLTGVVKTINYALGDTINMGKPLAVIDDISSLSVNVDVPESDLEKLSKDTKSILSISGFSKKINSKITKINRNINPKTRVGEIQFQDIDLEDDKVAIGGTVMVEFIIGEAPNAITIQANSIKRVAEKEIVYLIKDGIAEERLIKTGLQTGETIEILEGLELEDRIAVSGINNLYDGAKVYILEGNLENEYR